MKSIRARIVASSLGGAALIFTAIFSMLISPVVNAATWDGRGTWPDGSSFRVELRYTWGVTHRLLHFTTYEWKGSRREPLYEGFVFFDPARDAVFQWNVKPDGTIVESRVTRADSTGYAVLGAHTRSTIRRTGPNEMRWILEVPRDSGWHTILDAPHRRR